MYCVCCKLRHAAPTRNSKNINQTQRLELPVVGPLAKNFLTSNPEVDLFANFKESSEELLCSLLEKEIFVSKELSRDSKRTQDLEETNLSEQASQDEKLYRLLFRRIYIENYTAGKLIKEDLRLLDRVYYPESFERALIETLDQAAIIYCSILNEKLQSTLMRTSISYKVTIEDLYEFFNEIVEIINIIIDYCKTLRTYSKQINSLLRYLENSNMIEPLHYIQQEWLHRRCIRSLLQDPLLKDICTLIKLILKTNTLSKYQSTEDLQFIVDCCFSNQIQEMFLSRSCTQFEEYEEDEAVNQQISSTTINQQRLQCVFGSQFLKNIERKVRKFK